MPSNVLLGFESIFFETVCGLWVGAMRAAVGLMLLGYQTTNVRILLAAEEKDMWEIAAILIDLAQSINLSFIILSCTKLEHIHESHT